MLLLFKFYLLNCVWWFFYRISYELGYKIVFPLTFLKITIRFSLSDFPEVKKFWESKTSSYFCWLSKISEKEFSWKYKFFKERRILKLWIQKGQWKKLRIQRSILLFQYSIIERTSFSKMQILSIFPRSKQDVPS